MKTSIPIITISSVLVALAATLVGCDKNLKEDPKGSLTPITYFKTQNDLDAAVAGMYLQLARDGAWGFTSKMFSYFGSDDLTTDPGLNKGDQREFDELSGSSINQSLPSEWNGPWAAIYNANNILANYAAVNSTDDLKKASAGQAYFIRGICYYYLVRTFGDLPIVLGPIDVSTRPARSPVDSVYAAIISDLQQAKSMLGTEKAQGKPNTYSASALLADVYLTMAGWPLNQTDNYALSASEAKIVMESGKYDLSTPYDQVFTTNNCAESIFALEYSVAGNLPNRSFGSTSVPLEETGIDGSTGWDDFYPELNFRKNAPDCQRSYLTFYDTIKLRNDDNTTYTLVPWNSVQTHARHPYYKKFRAGLVTNGGGDGVNETANSILTIQPSTNKETIVIRYPQVLLDYAEATAMSAGAPSADSYDAINQVRARAGEEPLQAGLSQTVFRDSVVRERAYEFAGEFGMRWFDIVRLQLLPQIIAERDPSEPNAIPAGVDVAKKYLAPIPFSEMVLNPDWKQNDGY